MIILLLCGSDALLAQKTWQVEYIPTPQKELPAVYSSKKEAVAAVQNKYATLLSEGYLDARIDTLSLDSVLVATIVPGGQYLIRSFSWLADSGAVLQPRPMTFRKPHLFSKEEYLSEIDEVLSTYENRGFPFASITLVDLKLDERTADVVLSLDAGPRIVMDSLVLRTNSKLPYKYIRSYLDFHKGDLYDESKMLGVERRLREIPFVVARQAPEVRFNPEDADLFVFLEKKKANFFNGILGIRPDDQTGRVNLTGDAEIKLISAFNGGEEFYFNWRKLQVLTQDLTVKLMLPFLFSSPLGVDGQVKIYKRDSTFTSAKTNAGLVFNFGGNNRLRVFAEKNSTNQISSYITAQPLANVNSTLYGLSIQLEKLDYRLNPRRGFSFMVEGATGNRKISETNLTAETLANNIPQKNLYRIEGQSEYYIPTFKSQCILVGVRGAGLFTSTIFENEMYRIGGLRTLRGVDEESIFSTSYLVGTIEYRLLFEENSALYVFADQSWYEKRGADAFVTDTPYGFGAGVNFETKAGIFTFNYALGHQFNNPMLVRNAKVSFGFRNVF